MPGTIKLHRVFRCPPDRLFKALTDPAAKVKWIAPHGYVAHMHACDCRVGGSYRMSFTSLATGESHAFGGTYLELVPSQRIRYSDTFDDPNLPGTMDVTFALREVMGGTELSIVQEGVPDAIPTEMCYMGWQQSLQLLQLLVEI